MKILGLFLLCLPFLGLIGITVAALGWMVLIPWGVIIGSAVSVIIGVNLLLD